MIKTLNRSGSSQISIKSNILKSPQMKPQDTRGARVNINAPLTQTFIFAHSPANMPQVVREVHIEEDREVTRERQLLSRVSVVRVQEEEHQKKQEVFDFQSHITHLLTQYNTEKRDAHETAQMLTEEILKHEAAQRRELEQNRSIALKRVTDKQARDVQKEAEDNMRNKVEVKRLYRSIQEVVQHILAGGGEQKFRRFQMGDNESKEHVTLDYIKDKQRGVEEIKQASEVMQLVRVFLSKKTDEFEVMQKLYGDGFLTDPSIIKDMSESKDCASVASDRLSKANESLKQSEEDARLSKFYNLTDLKVKWGVKSEADVKDNIRRILTRDVLQEGERKKVKQEIEEEEIRQRLIKTDARFARMFKEQQRKKEEKAQMENEAKDEKERMRKVKSMAALKKREEQEEQQRKHAKEYLAKRNAGKKQKNPVREAENKVRKEFFETSCGEGLVYGDIFQRTKNFGDLFQQKTQEFYTQSVYNSSQETSVGHFTSTNTLK